MRGTVLLASTALLAAGCTTYQPVGQGSDVPWADALVAKRAALSGAEGASQGRVIRTASLPREDPTGGPTGRGATGTAMRITPLASDTAPPASDPTRPAVEEITETETVAIEVVEAEPAGPATHTVARGEWMLALARQYEVDPRALAAANGLEPPYPLKPGQVLTIPEAEEAVVVAAVEPEATPAPPPQVSEARPAEPAASEAVYVVQKGDVLGAIARQHGLSVSELAAANALSSPYPLKPGQELQVPEASSTPAVEVAVAAPEPAVAPSIAPDEFLWPVDGRVIARFGDDKDGESRSGIAIEARKGAPVKAAQRGVVVYAGDAIRGYGRMILLRHDDGYVTAYGHNSALLVNVGATVDQGQVIARVGDTGGVPSPQLHFEVRKGKQPIDPETVLAAQAGHSTG